MERHFRTNISRAPTSRSSFPVRLLTEAACDRGTAVIEYDGRPIVGKADLIAAVTSTKPGSNVALVLVRGKAEIHVAFAY